MPIQDPIATGEPSLVLGAISDAFVLGSSSNAAVQSLERTIAHIAPTNIPVLIIGETGTGKEIVAQQIHRASSRRHEPVVKEICASLSEESLSMHFGINRKNGGTGHKGLGTLFLEEISELDPASQRNLLYALPEEDALSENECTGPRLISSTTRNLEEEMRTGRFRTELYYRINGTCLRLPALRQRKEDIPALAELLLTKYAAFQGRPRPLLEASDLATLQEFSWPGNIRELGNVMKKIAVLGDPKLVLSELVAERGEIPPSGFAAKGSLLKAATRAASRKTEKHLILDALTRTRWNRKRAAQELQISYKSLLYKLKEIGAEEPNKA